MRLFLTATAYPDSFSLNTEMSINGAENGNKKLLYILVSAMHNLVADAIHSYQVVTLVSEF